MIFRDNTYLDAMVTIGEVLHRLELLINDSNACFVCSVDDALNVFSGLTHSFQLLVQTLSSLDCSLGVELGCQELA